MKSTVKYYMRLDKLWKESPLYRLKKRHKCLELWSNKGQGETAWTKTNIRKTEMIDSRIGGRQFKEIPFKEAKLRIAVGEIVTW